MEKSYFSKNRSCKVFERRPLAGPGFARAVVLVVRVCQGFGPLMMGLVGCFSTGSLRTNLLIFGDAAIR
jgi:hypothetical protein